MTIAIGTIKEEGNSEEDHFERELEYYRTNFFLDPKGSNAEQFLKNVSRTASALIKWYTGKDFEIKIESLGCPDRSIGNGPAKGKKGLNEIIENMEMPYDGLPIEDVIDSLLSELRDEVRFDRDYIAHMVTMPTIASYIGGLIGMFINGNKVAQEVSRKATDLERKVITWLADAFGYTPDISWMFSGNLDDPGVKKLAEILGSNTTASGCITSGGTTANFAAVLVARNKAYRSLNLEGEKGVAELGMTGMEDGVIIGSEQSHYSLEKLCGYAGLGTDNFWKVKTRNNKMIISGEDGSLRDKMWGATKNGKKVVGVFATAGTTETGNIDNLEAIGSLIDEFEKEFGYRPHYHVDAAFGGGFVFHDAFNPKKGGLLKGIERADSITVDPHKMLYIHYNAGSILFKNKKDYSLLKQSASYLWKEDGKYNIGQFTIEGSMGISGATQTYAGMMALGQRGYHVIQEHALRMAEYLEKRLREEKIFEIMSVRETNVLSFRYYNPDFSDELNKRINEAAQDKLAADGNADISDTLLWYRPEYDKVGHKVNVFRAVVMNPYITKEDIDKKVKEVTKSVLSSIPNCLSVLSRNTMQPYNYTTKIHQN